MAATFLPVSGEHQMTSAPSPPVTKRQFINALACPTMAFFDRQRSGEALEPATQWRFHEGNRVGELAREALGGGRMLPPPFSTSALADSAAALADGDQTLFEASMWASGMMARADALVPCPGGWELIEVKSSKMPKDGKPKAEYIDDVAYTLCVAQLAGVPVVRVLLMLLSREYTLGSHEPVFGRLDVTAEAMSRAAVLQAEAPNLVGAMVGDQQPEPRLTMACKECEYFATTCIGQGVDDSVLRIPRINAKKLAEIAPCARIRMLPASTTLTDIQQHVVDVIRERAARRDDTILAELKEIIWPAFYLDFESVMPALPWFDGDGAYTTLPNQYSVHVCSSPGEVLRHAEYLAPFDTDWRRNLTEQLLGDLDGNGSIIVYSSYERTQLSSLASRFPDLEGRLSSASDRLFDLERFFKSGYVHHAFAGSSSIKQVLPVLVPDLSYERMEVGNGSDAAAVFCLMREGVISPEKHPARRRELLEYCGLDTMAMVRLHEALTKL